MGSLKALVASFPAVPAFVGKVLAGLLRLLFRFLAANQMLPVLCSEVPEIRN